MQARPDLRLLLGGGPQALQAHSAELGLEGQGIPIGGVPHGYVYRDYSRVGTFVGPRLPRCLIERVIPLEPLEAEARGKPVVAPEVGRHGKRIVDGSTGHRFRTGAPDVLRQAVPGDRQRRHRPRLAGCRFGEAQRNSSARLAGHQPVSERLLQRATG